MTMQLPIIEDGHLLTHSSEACWKTCGRKFYLQNVLGLRPRHTSDPLRMGTAFHLGLECFKQREPEAAAAQAVRDLYADAACPPWLGADEFAVEETIVTAMVRAYYRRWWGDQIMETVACELSFEVPIVNPETGRVTPTFRSAGKIDGIVRLPDGRLAILEHKTTADVIDAGSHYWRRLLMDSQISRYVLAARALGYDVQTTVYDVVRKPMIRPKAIAKADRAIATSEGHYFGIELHEACPERESPKLYGARLLDDMAQRPTFYFARNEVPRLDSDLEEFRREQWTLQQAIRDAALKSRFWGASAYPRNTNACLAMGTCQYFDVCRGITGNIEEEIPAGFVVTHVAHPELAAAKEDKQ